MTTGFVYVATGDPRYHREAVASAESLRRHNPAARLCLVTDIANSNPLWNDVVRHPDSRRGFRDKIAMHLCPYDSYLYLDTDTLVVGNLSGVFDLLTRFDFCGQQLFEGHNYSIPEVPDLFGEFNTGVLGFRRNERTREFFEMWLEQYDHYARQNQSGLYDYSNDSDQKSFRVALYRSSLQIAVLPAEFNFTSHFPFPACLPVHVLHERRLDGLAPLAERMNAKLGPRAYIPSLDAVVSDNMGAGELWRTLSGAMIQLSRLAARKVVPLTIRNSLRRSPWVRRTILRQQSANDSGLGSKK